MTRSQWFCSVASRTIKSACARDVDDDRDHDDNPSRLRRAANADDSDSRLFSSGSQACNLDGRVGV